MTRVIWSKCYARPKLFFLGQIKSRHRLLSRVDSQFNPLDTAASLHHLTSMKSEDNCRIVILLASLCNLFKKYEDESNLYYNYSHSFAEYLRSEQVQALRLHVC